MFYHEKEEEEKKNIRLNLIDFVFFLIKNLDISLSFNIKKRYYFFAFYK